MCLGNDAAAQIAETIGGSYEGFAEIMNNKAKELGLSNTNFVTPHGLDNEMHYTTAYELAMLTNIALSNEKFAELVKTKQKTILINGQARNLNNSNELLGNLSGVYGVKTGFTNNAGRCLVTACKRGDLDVIVVVIGADTKNFRTKDSIKIIEYAYSNFEIINLTEMIQNEFEKWCNEIKGSFIIEKGKTQFLELKLEKNDYTQYPIRKGSKDDIKFEMDCRRYFSAPVDKDRSVGSMQITIDKEVTIELNIYTKEAVGKKESADYFWELLCSYHHIFK